MHCNKGDFLQCFLLIVAIRSFHNRRTSIGIATTIDAVATASYILQRKCLSLQACIDLAMKVDVVACVSYILQ